VQSTLHRAAYVEDKAPAEPSSLLQRAAGPYMSVIRVVLRQAQDRCHSEADVNPAAFVTAPCWSSSATEEYDHTRSQ
jgi:hypothetical protein